MQGVVSLLNEVEPSKNEDDDGDHSGPGHHGSKVNMIKQAEVRRQKEECRGCECNQSNL